MTIRRDSYFMPRSTDVVVVVGTDAPSSDTPPPAIVAPPTTTKPARRAKATPLPMSQMVPMTFVLLNESLCQTMLLPFVGLLVSFLQDKPKEEAGYLTGVLVGCFALGQVLSAKTWGWLSDKYGRRFPLISGLFTSGIFMVFFGLSSHVWQCALFRFLHGVCSGNVLVSKVVMADITDKSNQAKGFAFISLCFGLGTLVGPLLGGLLFDPTAADSAASFLGLSKDGIFAQRPALLPSLFIFAYTNVGMAVCTFFVQESNMMARPLPRVLQFVYPCMLVPWKWFKKPPPPPSDGDDDEADQAPAVSTEGDGTATAEEGKNDGPRPGRARRRRMCLVEDVRRYETDEEEALDAAEQPVAPADAAADEDTGSRSSDRSSSQEGSAGTQVHVACVQKKEPAVEAAGAAAQKDKAKEAGTALSHALVVPVVAGDDDDDDEADAGASTVVAAGPPGDLMPGYSQVASPMRGGGVFYITFRKFGYRQAFSYSPTQFLLVSYMLLCSGAMAVDESYPLWMIASRQAGGLNYTSSQVGYIMIFNSFPTVVANLVFHRFANRYDDKMKLYRLSLFITAAAVFTTPFASYLPVGWPQVALILVCSAVRMAAIAFSYAIVTLLTAVSAPVGFTGMLMGVNQSCGALTRGLVPLFIDPLFAFSISSPHVPPFNHLLTFTISALTLTTNALWTFSRRTNTAGIVQFNDESWLSRTFAACRRRLCSG